MEGRRGFVKKLVAVPLALVAGKLTALATVIGPKPNYVVEVRLGGESVARVPVHIAIAEWNQLEIGLTPMGMEKAAAYIGSSVMVQDNKQMLDDFYIGCEDKLVGACTTHPQIE